MFFYVYGVLPERLYVQHLLDGAWGGQKGALDPLQLKLTMIASCHAGARN